VYDSLKPGGIFYIEDFGRKDNTELTEEERKATEVGVFNGVLSTSEYRALLEQAGFVVESFVDRSKEWSRYVFNRSNNHIADGDQLRA